jgi:hypothetical protein
VAAELAKRALAATPASRGHYLASGVTVASFVPMRAIPFRAVFVLGLGQDAFPRPAGRHELDLRAGGARPATWIAASRICTCSSKPCSRRATTSLSYVARDEITGDELPSSPVLLELRSMLAQGYLDPAQLAELFGDDLKQRPPLRRFDDSDRRRAVLPAAEAEHQAKELGARLAKGEAGRARARRAATVPAASKSDPAATVVVPLSALRRFLEDPLQGSARFRLGMRDDDERAPADVEDEPFDMDKRGSVVSGAREHDRRDPGRAGGAAMAGFARRLRTPVEPRRACRTMPTGLFRSAGAQVEQELLRAWHEELPKILGQRRAECRVVRLAARPPGTPCDERAPASSTVPRPASRLPARRCGRAWPRGPSRRDRRGFAPGWRAPVTPRWLHLPRRHFRQGHGPRGAWAFLDYVVSDRGRRRARAPGHRSAVFFTKTGTASCAPWVSGRSNANARATTWRGCAPILLTGALDAKGAATGVHPYLLPHEAVFESQRKQTPIVDAIDDCARAPRATGQLSVRCAARCRGFSNATPRPPPRRRAHGRGALRPVLRARAGGRRMSQPCAIPSRKELARLGRGHSVVESSAGTGKTFLLEHLFVDLILTHGLACEEILVVTFTEKATAELVLRLRALIARLAGLRADDAKAIEAASAPATRAGSSTTRRRSSWARPCSPSTAPASSPSTASASACCASTPLCRAASSTKN